MNVNDPLPLCPKCRHRVEKGRRWRGTVRWRCPQCKGYSVLAAQTKGWEHRLSEARAGIVAMVKNEPMRRDELALRTGLSERQLRDYVKTMPDQVHEWDGQVYAGPIEPWLTAVSTRASKE